MKLGTFFENGKNKPKKLIKKEKREGKNKIGKKIKK
jgi:hypothetical protein